MTIGTALALLLLRLSSWVRVLLMSGLVLVWSVPVVVAVQVWYWMTNYQNGVLNYVLTQLHLGDFFHHDWYATTFSQLGIVTAMIVWGALPFVVVTVYAGLAQVPRDLVEAAEIDGANPFRVFRDVTVPILMPVLLDPHEPLDHLGLRGLHAALPADRPGAHAPVELPDGHVSLRGGVREERLRPRRGDLAADARDRRGAEHLLRPQDGQDGRRRVSAPAVETRARRGRGRRRARQSAWDAFGDRDLRLDGLPGLLDDLDGVQAGRPGEQPDADVALAPADSASLPHAMHQPFFWNDVVNTLIIVGVTVAIAMTMAFLAAVAVAKYRFTGPQAVHRDGDRASR